MGIERLFNKTKNLSKKIFYGFGLTTVLLIGSCKIEVPSDVEITTDTKHVGMIIGNVTVPRILNNRITYEGFPYADVSIDGTNFSTKSLSNGSYAFDNISAGVYEIYARKLMSGYIGNRVSVIAIKQTTISAPDHKLTPNSDNQIIFGKFFRINKSTPIANQEIRIYTMMGSGGPGTLRETTISSSDGSYAFYHGYNNYVLTSGGKQLKFTDTNLNYIIFNFGDEVTNKDIYEPN